MSARTIVCTDLSLEYTGMSLGRKATNQQTISAKNVGYVTPLLFLMKVKVIEPDTSTARNFRVLTGCLLSCSVGSLAGWLAVLFLACLLVCSFVSSFSFTPTFLYVCLFFRWFVCSPPPPPPPPPPSPPTKARKWVGFLAC